MRPGLLLVTAFYRNRNRNSPQRSSTPGRRRTPTAAAGRGRSGPRRQRRRSGSVRPTAGAPVGFVAVVVVLPSDPGDADDGNGSLFDVFGPRRPFPGPGTVKKRLRTKSRSRGSGRDLWGSTMRKNHAVGAQDGPGQDRSSDVVI